MKPSIVPGSAYDLVEAIDLKAQLAVRTELRRLRDIADALLAVTFVTDPPHAHLLEYGGDRSVMPSPLPPFVPSVPSAEVRRCADGDEHAVVFHVVRVGRGWPVLGLGVVDAELAPPALADVVEDAGARLETLVVGAVERRTRRRGAR